MPFTRSSTLILHREALEKYNCNLRLRVIFLVLKFKIENKNNTKAFSKTLLSPIPNYKQNSSFLTFSITPYLVQNFTSSLDNNDPHKLVTNTTSMVSSKLSTSRDYFFLLKTSGKMKSDTFYYWLTMELPNNVIFHLLFIYINKQKV